MRAKILWQPGFQVCRYYPTLRWNKITSPFKWHLPHFAIMKIWIFLVSFFKTFHILRHDKWEKINFSDLKCRLYLRKCKYEFFHFFYGPPFRYFTYPIFVLFISLFSIWLLLTPRHKLLSCLISIKSSIVGFARLSQLLSNDRWGKCRCMQTGVCKIIREPVLTKDLNVFKQSTTCITLPATGGRGGGGNPCPT